MKPLKLIDRFDLNEVPSKGIWFRLEGVDDVSILNVGKLMSSAPFKWEGFNGWEILLKNGEIIRRDTLKEIKECLAPL